MGIIRHTKSVKSLIQAFNESENAISVAVLLKRFKEDMNKTTVYRILDRMEESGVLHSFIGKDGDRWYSKYTENTSASSTISHPHFQCDSCGKSECLTLDINIPPLPNHKVDSASLLLIGQCQDCLIEITQ